MGIYSCISSTWDWIKDCFSDDTGKVRNAMSAVSNHIFSTRQARDWLQRSGWNACGDVCAAMRNNNTRDAAIFDAINSFYQSGDDAGRMLQRFTENGLNNGTTTRTYIINSGEGSIGRSDSNHQAILMVDESQSPPIITLGFRGMNPLREGLGVVGGMISAAFGRSSSSYERQAALFWQGAGPDIQRIIGEAQARNPDVAPQINVAGHSYGADGAARMIPHLAQIVPPESLRYVGYGNIQSMTKEERDGIWQILGGERAGRATYYMSNHDWVRLSGWAYTLGTRRDIPSGAGHVDYAPTGNVAALMSGLQAQMERDPSRAREIANRIIAEFDRDSGRAMSELASYTSSPPSGGLPQRATRGQPALA